MSIGRPLEAERVEILPMLQFARQVHSTTRQELEEPTLVPETMCVPRKNGELLQVK